MSKILIVDDEVKPCELLKRILETDENEYEIMTSHSGEDALEKVKSFKLTLILLDIKMPGMNGIEVLRQVRKFDKAVADETFRMAADDYISKPVQVSFLESRIFIDIMSKKIIRKKYRDKDSEDQRGNDYFG